MATIKTRYLCHGCLELHEDEWDAEHCGSTEKVYVCSACGQGYSGIDEAESCCPDALPFISHAELEALGQLRLIP